MAATGYEFACASADPGGRNVVPPQHNWNAVSKHATQISQHLNNAFAAIHDANLRLRGAFGDVDFAKQERFPDVRLEKLLAHFEKHRLRNSDVPPDMLGAAYMQSLRRSRVRCCSGILIDPGRGRDRTTRTA